MLNGLEMRECAHECRMQFKYDQKCREKREDEKQIRRQHDGLVVSVCKRSSTKSKWPRMDGETKREQK